MDLHRTTGKPDWAETKPTSYNVFQKIAAATRGVVTPANFITIAGLAIVIYGLVVIIGHHFLLGLILLAVGRLLDIADGLVAQATHTKSPLGETLDAAVDKIGTILTIAVLFVTGVTYWWLIVILLIPQVIIPLVIFYKKQKGIQVHPTRQGKLSMALTWVGIVGLLIVKAADGFWPLTIVVYGLIVVSLILGFYALWQYTTGRD